MLSVLIFILFIHNFSTKNKFYLFYNKFHVFNTNGHYYLFCQAVKTQNFLENCVSRISILLIIPLSENIPLLEICQLHFSYLIFYIFSQFCSKDKKRVKTLSICTSDKTRIWCYERCGFCRICGFFQNFVKLLESWCGE